MTGAKKRSRDNRPLFFVTLKLLNKFYLILQTVPWGESNRTIFLASSVSRISSLRAKSRDFRAVARSSIKLSIYSREIPISSSFRSRAFSR
jgi:hypothetical protein